MKSRHLVGQTVCASKCEWYIIEAHSTQHSRFDFYGRCTHTHRRHLLGQIFEPRDVVFNTVFYLNCFFPCLGGLSQLGPSLENLTSGFGGSGGMGGGSGGRGGGGGGGGGGGMGGGLSGGLGGLGNIGMGNMGLGNLGNMGNLGGKWYFIACRIFPSTA